MGDIIFLQRNRRRDIFPETGILPRLQILWKIWGLTGDGKGKKKIFKKGLIL